jgi:hypothetical protein
VNPFLSVLCLGFITGTGLAPAEPARRVSSPSPVVNFSLPIFNDEGYHSMLIRGAQASLRNPARIELTDMTLTVFSGDESRTPETILLSPLALVFPGEERVEGPGALRLVRPDLELTGADWSYDHGAKKILINRRSRIVFPTSLTHLLK